MWAWTDRPGARVPLIGAVLVLGAAQAAIWIAGLPEGAGTTGFAWRAMILFALSAAALALLWRRRDPALVLLVLGFALVFRAGAWCWPPDLSSDLNRYVWDGRVQLAGHSPYAAPPADPSLAGLRDDEVWPRINRPEAITVYPPGGQVAFAVLAALGGDSVWDVKTAAALAELVALALVALLLARRRAGAAAAPAREDAPGWRWPRAGPLALYAWSPLVVSETAVSGHVDALVLPLLVGGLWLARASGGDNARWRGTLAGALLGAGALIKLYPVLLLAAVPKAQRVRAALAAGVVAVVAYVPYAAVSGSHVLGFLPEYARSGEDFNPAVRGLLEAGLAPLVPHGREIAMAVCAVALTAAVVAIARRGLVDSWLAARWLALCFVLLLPTAIHPWYAVWLVPLLALRPHPAGIWIVGLVPLSYLKYGAPGEIMPAWIPAAEWLPALALLAVPALRRRFAQPEVT